MNKLLLCLFLLVSCGKQKIDISDSDHTLTVKFDLPSLMAGIITDCEARYENPAEVQSCIEDQTEMIQNLLDALNDNGFGSGSGSGG